jgi:hypothetical protein
MQIAGEFGFAHSNRWHALIKTLPVWSKRVNPKDGVLETNG